MKLKLLFPALCALMISFVGCKKDEPQEPKEPATQEENNQKEEDKDTKGPKLNVYEIEADAAGGEYKVQLTSTSMWSALSDKKWVSLDPEMGNGNAIVSVTVKPGTESDTATIKFVNDEGSAVLLLYRVMPYISIGISKRALFSPGNLQYQAGTKTWRFAENQYDVIGMDNANISSTYDGWTDLFGWGTGNNPVLSTSDDSYYSEFWDWGANKIGSDAPYTWRTLNKWEWEYIFRIRDNAAELFGMAKVNGVNGVVIFPDNWTIPAGLTFAPSSTYDWQWGCDSDYNFAFYDKNENNFNHNKFTAAEWRKMEAAGAIFLPATGGRKNGNEVFATENGYYWTSSPYEYISHAFFVMFSRSSFYLEIDQVPSRGYAVRLVQDVK